MNKLQNGGLIGEIRGTWGENIIKRYIYPGSVDLQVAFGYVDRFRLLNIFFRVSWKSRASAQKTNILK